MFVHDQLFRSPTDRLTTTDGQKLLAERRRKRVLNASGTRLDYIQNRTTKEKLVEKEKEASNSTSNSTDIPNDTTDAEHIGDAFQSQRSNPFMNCNAPNNSNPTNPDMERLHNLLSGAQGMGGMPGMGGIGGMGGIPGMNTLDPSMGLQGMMEQMFGASNGQNSKQIAEKRKKEEKLEQYDRYSHNSLCLIFVALLVFLPDQYDPTLIGYSLSSDPWTFFMALEIVLFSVFFGYKQYLQGQYDKNQAQIVEYLFFVGGWSANNDLCSACIINDQ